MALSSPWSRLVAQRLSSLGLEIHVVEVRAAGPDGGYLERDGPVQTAAVAELEKQVAGVHRIRTSASRMIGIVRSAFALRRLARRIEADVAITLYGGANAAALFLSRIRPYVVYVVGSDVLLATGSTRRIARTSLTHASLVLANGKYLATKTAELAPAAEVVTLYLGTDLRRHHHSAPKGVTPTFVSTRGFLGVYDNETIVRAVAAVATQTTPMKMTFASSGPLLAQAIALADQLIPSGRRHQVVFLGGVGEREMEGLLQSNSYYVSASLSDGASSSLLEALASRLFPIVSDIPANREWITHEENGLLFPPGDHVALATCLGRAIKSESWMDGARDTNRLLVRERADADTNMARLAELLRGRASRAHATDIAPVLACSL